MLASHFIAYKVKQFTVRSQEVNWKQKGKFIQISWVPSVTSVAPRAFCCFFAHPLNLQQWSFPTYGQLVLRWVVRESSHPQVPGCHSGSVATGCRSSSWSAVPGWTWQKSWQQQPGAVPLVNGKGCFALELLPGAASLQEVCSQFQQE